MVVKTQMSVEKVAIGPAVWYVRFLAVSVFPEEKKMVR